MRSIKNEWLAGGSDPWRIRELAFASKIQRRTWRRSLARELGRLRPITEPDQLGPALGKAIEIVHDGKPAVVDVITQAR